MIALLLAAALAAPRPDPVGSMLADFAQQADPVHGRQLARAVAASPQLADQLGRLAGSGQFKGFALDSAPPAAGAGAWSADGVIHFTPQFLDQQAHPRRRLPDGDYSKNNPDELVFILGVIGAQLGAQAELSARTAGMTPAVAEALRAQSDARAFLQGWADELDAAVKAKGAPLSAAEAFDLLKKGNNSTVIGAAATLPPGQRLVPGDGFSFAPSDHNVQAVAGVLLGGEAR